jgi:hypothetical protein
MGILGKIFKWIIIWTIILFVPIFAFAVLATILVAAALGAIASGGTMIAMAIYFFFSPPVLTIWVLGVVIICLVNLPRHIPAKKNLATIRDRVSEIRKVSRRKLLLALSACIIVSLLIIFAVASYVPHDYYLNNVKGSQTTLRIQMNDAVNLHVANIEYTFNYYYSAGILEKSPLKVGISKNWGALITNGGGFYAIVGSVNYDSDGGLKITVLEANSQYVRLLVERV